MDSVNELEVIVGQEIGTAKKVLASVLTGSIGPVIYATFLFVS